MSNAPGIGPIREILNENGLTYDEQSAVKAASLAAGAIMLRELQAAGVEYERALELLPETTALNTAGTIWALESEPDRGEKRRYLAEHVTKLVMRMLDL